MSKIVVQYGCGLSAPKEWINFDVSPTLRLQKIPIIGNLFKKISSTKFPSNVRYGDIIKGLPIPDQFCDGLYCSHTLEHLSLEDFRVALKNSHRVLKQGGIFRCIVPDLEFSARKYINSLEQGNHQASIDFIGKDTLLGQNERQRGIGGFIRSFLGNSNHLWMWDKHSLSTELKKSGFSAVRTCSFNDSELKEFMLVEEKSRFINAVALEAIR